MSDFRKYLNVHEFETTLPGSGEVVRFKPITTGQIKKLLVYEDDEDPLTLELALDDIIKYAVIDEDFDLDSLILQDRFFLLVEIRRKSKGDFYEFDFGCPECGSQTFHRIDLKELVVDPPEEKINPWIDINDFISIELGLITRGYQRLASEFVQKEYADLNLNQKLAEMSLIATAAAINSIRTPEGIDEEATLEDKLELLNSLSQSEFERVTDWYDSTDFGVKFTYNVSCKHLIPPKVAGGPGKPCKFDEEITIPMTNFFF